MNRKPKNAKVFLKKFLRNSDVIRATGIVVGISEGIR